MKKHKCTECNGDAEIGMSAVKDLKTGKYIIGKKERLCLECSKKRQAQSITIKRGEI